MTERNLRNITVKKETMVRLNRLRAEMELAFNGTARISLDSLINMLIDRIEDKNGKH